MSVVSVESSSHCKAYAIQSLDPPWWPARWRSYTRASMTPGLAYDQHALRYPAWRQPPAAPVQTERKPDKNKAISFRGIPGSSGPFPGDKATVFDPFMAKLGYDTNDISTDTSTPSGVGNVACASVPEFPATTTAQISWEI